MLLLSAFSSGCTTCTCYDLLTDGSTEATVATSNITNGTWKCKTHRNLILCTSHAKEAGGTWQNKVPWTPVSAAWKTQKICEHNPKANNNKMDGRIWSLQKCWCRSPQYPRVLTSMSILFLGETQRVQGLPPPQILTCWNSKKKLTCMGSMW